MNPEPAVMPAPERVYFFATCLIDLLYPKAGLAGMQLLKRAGLTVIFPDNQTCCGQPAFNSGYRDEALAVARAQLACFGDDIPVVVPSGSCAGMIKTHWPELFAGQPDEALALAVAARTYELTEFLVDVLAIELSDLGEPVKVAVHTSCSARREMGVADRIQTLLAQLDQVEVLTQEREAECCGFGGTFAIKQADISGAMVQDKTGALRATGADRVVSQDCGCLLNIGGAFAHQGNGPTTQHIAEFLLERSA
jgi:L-lactate dehydrogenase complex protein LldE